MQKEGHILLEKVETNTESITVAQWLLQVILCKKKTTKKKTKQNKTKQTNKKNPPAPPRSKTIQGISILFFWA